MKLKLILFISACTLFIASCSSSKNSSSGTSNSKASNTSHEMLNSQTYKITEISTDDSYGYSQKNAVNVGGKDMMAGPANERKYLNALLGPNGESIMYERRGSCCEIKSDNGLMGYAILDIYEVKYNDTMKPIVIYINMYDPGELKAPKGFTFRK